MAALHVPSTSFLQAFLPVARASLLPPAKSHPLLQQIQQRASNALNTSLLPSIFLPIPALVGGLWDGLLNAVPKKKTSHMKKRHRQMAGKALKDVTALNRCSSCGRLKRAHILCPYCVTSIKQWLYNGFKTPSEVGSEKSLGEESEESVASYLSSRDRETDGGVDETEQEDETDKMPYWNEKYRTSGQWQRPKDKPLTEEQLARVRNGEKAGAVTRKSRASSVPTRGPSS